MISQPDMPELAFNQPYLPSGNINLDTGNFAKPQKFNYIRPTRRFTRNSSSVSPRSSIQNPHIQSLVASNTNLISGPSLDTPPSLPPLDIEYFALLDPTLLPNAATTTGTDNIPSQSTFGRRNSSFNPVLNNSNPFSTFYAHPRARHSSQQKKLGRSMPESISEDDDDSNTGRGSMSETRTDSQSTDAISPCQVVSDDKQPILSIAEVLDEADAQTQPAFPNTAAARAFSFDPSPRSRSAPLSRFPVATAPLCSNPITPTLPNIAAANTRLSISKQPYPYPMLVHSSGTTPLTRTKTIFTTLDLRIVEPAAYPSHAVLTEKAQMRLDERRRGRFGGVGRLMGRMTAGQRILVGLIIVAILISLAVVVGVMVGKEVWGAR